MPDFAPLAPEVVFPPTWACYEPMYHLEQYTITILAYILLPPIEGYVRGGTWKPTNTFKKKTFDTILIIDKVRAFLGKYLKFSLKIAQTEIEIYGSLLDA